MTTTPIQTDRLAALVESRFEVLSLLVRLAGEQLALIEATDRGPLMRLLADKQSLLTQLADVERLLDPFRANDPDKRPWRTPEARAACQRNAELAEQKLAQLIELERRGETELRRWREGRAARLKNDHSPAEAERAYAAAPGVAACGLDFFDEG